MVVIVAVALLAAAGFAALFGRPRRDSIVEHQRAIETLREIAERTRETPERTSPDGHYPTDHVQFCSEPSPGRGHPRRPPVRQVRKNSPTRRSRPDYSSRPTVAHLPTIGPAAAAAEQPPPAWAPPASAPLAHFDSEDDGAPEHGATTTEVRRPPGVPTNRFGSARRAFAGVAVLAAIAASAFAAIHSPGSSHHATNDPRTARVLRSTSTSRTSASRPSTTTTTTTVPRSLLQPVVTAGGNGTIQVAFPVTVTLRATSNCWVLANDPADQTLYTGTLRPGQQQQIQASGIFDLRLGNSTGILISVNNIPLTLTGIASTATLTFAAT